MKFKKIMTFINSGLFFLILIVIYAMFSIKTNFQDLNFQHRQILKNLKSEYDQITTLKTEIAYLSSPERLRKLSSKYTDLDLINSSQIVNNDNQYDKSLQFASKPLEDNSYKVSKWRFKTMKNGTVKTVSSRIIGN